MPVPKVPFTVDDLESMPADGNRYEIIDGDLFVTPAPTVYHQRAQMSLVGRLLPYVTSIGLELFAAPTDVRVSRTTQVEPDLIALPLMSDADRSTRWIAMSRVMLAVEILSPSTRRLDREQKRRLYLAQGVREYWMVDIDSRSIEVWAAKRQAPRIARVEMAWQPVPERDPLVLDLVALFNEVSGLV